MREESVALVETADHSGTVPTAQRRKYVVLAVLFAAFTYNFLDRQVLSVALQAIKTDLHMSDTQLGILTGVAFSIFYSIVGIPIARWADRGNRSAIISLCLALLSATVALSSVAGSFLQLMLVRVGVGIGEAGIVPPAHSLIASYFERSERLRAMSILLLGGPISIAIGYLLGGWITQFFGWRQAFLTIAAPGLLLAIAAKLLVHDPRTSVSQPNVSAAARDRVATEAQAPTLRTTLAFLWRLRTFRHLLFAFTADSLFGCGLVQWLPVFYIRSHEMSSGEVGTWMALDWGIGMALGTYAGGYITKAATVNPERRQLRVMSLVTASYVPLTVAALLIPDKQVSLIAMFVAALVYGIASAPSYSLVQSLAPEHMRATAVALVFLFGNLVGLGFGPVAVGAISDALAHVYPSNSLRIALLLCVPGYWWVAAHYSRASRTVMADLVEQPSRRGLECAR